MPSLTFWLPDLSVDDCSMQTGIINHLQSTLLSTSNPVQIMKEAQLDLFALICKRHTRADVRFAFLPEYKPEIRRDV